MTAITSPIGRRRFISAILAAVPAAAAPAEREQPLYLLTYDHGGLVLWGIDHFTKCLREGVAWLDRYPSFKFGLDNEAGTPGTPLKVATPV